MHNPQDVDVKATAFRTQLRSCWPRAALILWVISSVFHALILGPMIAASSLGPRAVFLLTGVLAPVGMLVPSLAFGLLIAIYMCCQLPLKHLLRPTRARTLGAIGLWLILPVASLSLLPISAGYIGIISIRELHTDFASRLEVPLVAWALLPVCYLTACLLSFVYRHWWHRLLAYLLVWAGCLWLTLAAGTAQWFVL